MRTSRMSRDTASALAALTSRRSTRRAVSTAYAPIKKEESPSPLHHAEDGTSSASDDDSAITSARKRKRGTTTYPTTSPKTIHLSKTKPPKRARRQPAKRIKAEDGSVSIKPPLNWERMYNVAAEMRKLRPAPVDTMGCEALAEESVSPKDQRFQTLVSLMLSSQTKDSVTAAAMRNLQQNLPGGLNLESVIKCDRAVFNSLINKVGFHNNKTAFIQRAAAICLDEHAGDIPDTIEGLVALPGVGPKMAYLTMSAAWGRDEGIGVDVHVHRITNLWGWHRTANPEATRASLEAWLPRDKWHAINGLLVGFGQTWCPPVGRKCGECRLGIEQMCPSAVIDRRPREVVHAKRKVQVDDGTVDEVAVKAEATQTVENGIVVTATATSDIQALPDIEEAIEGQSMAPAKSSRARSRRRPG